MQQAYQLDNAAKVFPATTTRYNSSVFRLAVTLKEKVVPERLQSALDKTVRRYPFFAVQNRNGLFWHYIKCSEKRIIVAEESEYPCASMEHKSMDGFLMRVLYYKKRISVELFHTVTDGFGGLEFLKTLLYEYLLACGKHVSHDGMIRIADQSFSEAEIEDSFEKYYDPDIAPNKSKPANAYHIEGTRHERYGNCAIHGVYDAEELNAGAKQRGLTITQFLCAALAYAIKRESGANEKAADTVISVPVNLRQLFPSGTLKNFFCVPNIKVPYEKTAFDDMCAQIKTEFGAKVNREYLQSLMAENHNIFAHPFIRIAPLFLKNAGTKFVFCKWGENAKSITFSNLGRLVLPRSVEEYVDRVEALTYPTPKSPLGCAVCTAAGRLTVSFSSAIREKNVVRRFFEVIAEQTGFFADVYSNEWS